MDIIERRVGKDIYGMIDDYTKTVILLGAYGNMINVHSSLKPEVIIYLDSINSPCVFRSYGESYRTDGGVHLSFITEVQYNNDLYWHAFLRSVGGRRYVVTNKTKKYSVYANDGICYNVLSYNRSHIVHPDIIDFYQSRGDKFKKTYLKYISNEKKITHIPRECILPICFLVADYKIKIKILADDFVWQCIPTRQQRNMLAALEGRKMSTNKIIDYGRFIIEINSNYNSIATDEIEVFGEEGLLHQAASV